MKKLIVVADWAGDTLTCQEVKTAVEGAVTTFDYPRISFVASTPSTIHTGFLVNQIIEIEERFGKPQNTVLFENTDPRIQTSEAVEKAKGADFIVIQLNSGMILCGPNAGYDLSFIKDKIVDIWIYKNFDRGSQFRSRDLYAFASLLLMEDRIEEMNLEKIEVSVILDLKGIYIGHIEFEKAHPHLLDIFLQVFDDGRLTDNAGRTISFVNSIIIATSNAGAEFIYEKISKQIPIEQFHGELVDALLKSQIFKPELVNRFDEVVIFKPLTEEDAAQVAKLMTAEALKTLEEQQLFITPDEKAIEKIGREGFSEEFGARNLRRYIQNSVEDFISKLILEEKLPKGTHGVLSVDEKGEFIIKK